MQLRTAVLSAWLALLPCMPLRAQDADAGITSFDVEVFSEAAPVNALDMVRRLPGFALVDADEDVRGYAGAQGNVLVDGARPASKRDGLEDVLRRIPAHAVARIDLIRGGAGGVEMFGHALVANVVRRTATVTDVAIEAGVVAATDGWRAPLAQVEVARQWSDHAVELSLSSQPELDEDTGRGRIVAFAPDGSVREDSTTDIAREQTLHQLNGNWRQPLGGGKLTLFAALRDTRDRETGRIATRLPDGENEDFDETETFREAEAGARYVRTFGEHTGLDAVVSQQLGWLDALSRARSDDGDERFTQRTRSGERIGRIDLRHDVRTDVTLNTGVEVAVNTLDGDARLIENDVAVPLPGARVHIDERRAEVSAGATWRPSDTWRIESSLRVERSRLAQRGDADLERAFTYFKPRLGLTWERSPREQWRATLSREVGQLDFEDFVASAALDTDVVSAGNVELEPDKTVRASLAWERRFWRDGAIVLTWHHDRIRDAIDRVPVRGGDDVFDAPGNIGDGTRDVLVLELGSTLERLGLANLRLASAVVWQRSRVRDPTTGERRGLSEEKPVEGQLSLTHTFPARRLSWGVDVDLAERETEYRFDEIQTERAGAAWTLFAEQGFGNGWRVRGELSDASGRAIRTTRERYAGLRGEVPIDERERRTHRTPGQLLLTLRREMGG